MEFTVNGVTLRINDISSKDQLEAQIHHNKAWQEGLERGMQLNAEVDQMLESRGLLNQAADQDKIEKLQESIANLTITLRSGIRNGKKMTKDEGRAVALLIRSKRSELSRVGESVASYYSATADTHANNERMQYLIYLTTYKGDSRYWSSYDTFKSDFGEDKPEAREAMKVFLKKLMNIDAGEAKTLYEIKWLTRMGYMNDKMELIDSKGRLVDEKGRLIDSEGYFINDAGTRVDKFGHVLDADGVPDAPDGWGESTNLPTNTVAADS
jgi:hypothetical protein